MLQSEVSLLKETVTGIVDWKVEADFDLKRALTEKKLKEAMLTCNEDVETKLDGVRRQMDKDKDFLFSKIRHLSDTLAICIPKTDQQNLLKQMPAFMKKTTDKFYALEEQIAKLKENVRS